MKELTNRIEVLAWEGFDQHFKLLRQPIMGLQGQKAQRWEILLRCSCGGIQELIEAFEAADLSILIDRWVITNGLSKIAQTAGGDHYSINISPLSLQTASIARHFVDQAAALALKQHVGVEVTERYVLPWSPRTSSALLFLKGEGHEIWLDDFGAGHSLLDLTDRVQPFGIKLDGSYIRRLTGDPRIVELVADLIRVAHDFGCQVTAEWIEDLSTADLLKDLGCDWGQGYLLGKPDVW